MYLQPNLYTVKKGQLTLHAFDPDYIYYAGSVRSQVKIDSYFLQRYPIVEESQSLLSLSAKCEKDASYAVSSDLGLSNC